MMLAHLLPCSAELMLWAALGWVGIDLVPVAWALLKMRLGLSADQDRT